MSIATNLKDLYKFCDPEVDLKEGRFHPYYSDLSSGRGSIHVTRRIRNTINLVVDEKGHCDSLCKVLLTGHKGTGKTTELNSLSKDLQEDGFFVVRFSGLLECNLEDLGWQDLLIELAYQVFEQGTAASEAGNIQSKPKKSFLDKIEDCISQTTLTEIVKHSAELTAQGEAGLKSPFPFLTLHASLKSLWKSGSERVKQIRKDLEPRANQLIHDLNNFLTDFQNALIGEGKRGLVVIVDELEKMTHNYPDSSSVNSHVDLFIHHSEHLKAPKCHIVYTMPVSLLYDHNVGELYSTLPPMLIPMVKVQNRDRSENEDSIDLLAQLLSKRVDLDALMDKEALRILTLKSGGHLRDLLRLVRFSAIVALEATSERITVEHAKQATKDLAVQAYSRLANESLLELEEIYRTQLIAKKHGHLAQNLLVLEYRNGEPWNDVHPCVMELTRVYNTLCLKSEDFDEAF